MSNTKICKKCLVEKNKDEFPAWKAKCKECQKVIDMLRAREYRKKKWEEINKRNRERYLEKKWWKLWRVIGAVIRDENWKVCSHCKQYKNWVEYTKEKRSKDWYAYCCKSCVAERKAKYRKTYKWKIAERNYKIINREKQRIASKKFLYKNKEKISEYKKQAYTIEDRRRWRKNYENRLTSPGAYVIWEEKKAEVLSRTWNVVRIRILNNGKHVLTYKTHLKLWKEWISLLSI